MKWRRKLGERWLLEVDTRQWMLGASWSGAYGAAVCVLCLTVVRYSDQQVERERELAPFRTV